MKLYSLLILGVLVTACQEPPKTHVYSLDDTPDGLRADVDRADAAIQALQATLIERLTSELGSRSPAGAVEVCRDEAQAITTRIAEEQGIDVGRTSHRLRNPENAPPPWLEPFVTEGADQSFDETQPKVIDLGDRIGIVRPINTLGLCTQCHGGPNEIPPEVQNVLTTSYPDDRAVGFSVGDLRGWMWAEAPRSSER